MEYNPLVTIVIPVYNGTNFMREAIDCALNQTYKKIEIIVINDGSTDDGATDTVAKSYGDRITYIYKENGGVSSALNLAISKMHGEWLSWLSHDDLYYPNKIERQINFINRLINENTEIDLKKTVVHCATESIDKDGKVIKTPSYRNIPEKEKTIDVIIDNVYNYRLSGCSFLIPSAAFEDVGGFREDIRTVSDVEFWYRLLFAGYQFYCMSDEILVKNRSHGKQVGKTKVSLFDQELNTLYIRIADTLAGNSEMNALQNIKRFYFGLEKRGLKIAAEHTKKEYIETKTSKIYSGLIMPIITSSWRVKGKLRNLIRDIFRKIYVK